MLAIHLRQYDPSNIKTLVYTVYSALTSLVYKPVTIRYCFTDDYFSIVLLCQTASLLSQERQVVWISSGCGNFDILVR